MVKPASRTFTDSEVASLNVLFCVINSPKPEEIQFTIQREAGELNIWRFGVNNDIVTVNRKKNFPQLQG